MLVDGHTKNNSLTTQMIIRLTETNYSDFKPQIRRFLLMVLYLYVLVYEDRKLGLRYPYDMSPSS